MNAAAAVSHPRRTLVLAATWVGAYFIARGILEGAGATWLRVLVALLPLPLFAAFLWSYVQLLRSLDELQRKLHLEALAIAFSLGLLLLTTLALMQRAVTLRFEDWSYAHVWVYFPIFYVLSLGFVSRRYSRE